VGVRIWGAVEDRLVELSATPGSDAVRIDGLPIGRDRTTADRVRAALINSGLVARPAASVQVVPELAGGVTGDLDLAIAIAILSALGELDPTISWVYATGQLGLDGAVFSGSERSTLQDVARSVRRWRGVGSERTFEREGR
jgi:predicted ATPase with chaperone activity